MAAKDKTEKATPKRRGELRRKGSVAKSMDLTGAGTLVAALFALGVLGPRLLAQMEAATVGTLGLIRTPDVVNRRGLMSIVMDAGQHVVLAAAPLVLVCALAGVVFNVAQVGFKPSVLALRPDIKKLNPVSGLKNMFGPRSYVEALKSLAKVAAVGGIVALAVLPKLPELAALTGMPAAALAPHLAKTILGVAWRAAAAYTVIALADFIYQRKHFDKSIRMDKQEVKDEFKQQELPGEVKSAQRRRAMQLARTRMMDAVPTADVVVTNPTHYSVALRYSPDHPAPLVVAKGADHVAFRIREIARAAGVAVVPDPPLARALHASVEVGRMIPEELYHGVALLLAYVYRVAGAKRTAAAQPTGVAA
jgi:flagellar biosynthesis protein FlhB